MQRIHHTHNNAIFAKRVGVFCTTWVALACSLPSAASPVPAYNTAELLQKSDTILVGKIVDKVPGSISDERIVTVMTERVVKGSGEVKPGALLRFSVSHPVQTDLRPGSHGLFVLQCGSGQLDPCVPAAPYQPGWPAVDAAIAVSGANDIDRISKTVVEELVATVSASDNALAAWTAGSQLSADEAEDLRVQATTALQTLPADLVLASLTAQGHPSNPASRLGIAAAQVRVGDVSALSDLNVAMTSSSPEFQASRRYLAWGLSYVTKPPAALLAPMTAWLRSPDEEVRRMAAMTLRQIGSRATVRPLLNALANPNWNVRYYAVTGLHAATHEGEGATTDMFRASEDRYVNFWRARKARLEATYE